MIQNEGVDSEIRAFVAVPLPDAVTNVIVDLQRQAEGATDDFYRWTPVASLHLTLYFLGECPPATLNEIHTRLERTNISPLTLCLDGILALPESNVPRILAVGLEGDVNELKRLQRQVTDLVSPVAPYKETRLFQPHITFGRLRKDKPSNAKQVKRMLQALAVPSGVTFTIDEFCTMKSDLAESGAEYEALQTFSLR